LLVGDIVKLGALDGTSLPKLMRGSIQQSTRLTSRPADAINQHEAIDRGSQMVKEMREHHNHGFVAGGEEHLPSQPT